jgi:hypothetical protein
MIRRESRAAPPQPKLSSRMTQTEGSEENEEDLFVGHNLGFLRLLL